MLTLIRSRLQKKLAEKQAEKHKILQLSKLSQPSLEISMLKIGEEISIIFDSKSDIIKYIILNRDGIALNIPIPDDLKVLQRKYIEFISTTEIGTIIAIKTINPDKIFCCRTNRFILTFGFSAILLEDLSMYLPDETPIIAPPISQPQTVSPTLSIDIKLCD